jgi:hypothetical protein
MSTWEGEWARGAVSVLARGFAVVVRARADAAGEPGLGALCGEAVRNLRGHGPVRPACV